MYIKPKCARENAEDGSIDVEFAPWKDQVADILTKRLELLIAKPVESVPTICV